MIPDSQEKTMSTEPNIQSVAAERAGAREPRPNPAGHGIQVDALHAYYGQNQAVKDFSIEFACNQVTAIIGPSGCGKSTMVRCINRMHEEIPGARAKGTAVTLGKVNVYDSRVNVTAVRRVIGMVFQKANPFPTMSISDNVASGLRLAGMRGGELRERVHRSLRAVGLWDEVSDRLGQPGVGLSGGQQQRLCIARTIAVEPEVILMDEPLLGAGPRRHPSHRGAHCRAQGALHDRDCDSQHAAGGEGRQHDCVHARR
jgi:phosphate transport system ATP-binding protein